MESMWIRWAGFELALSEASGADWDVAAEKGGVGLRW